MIGDHESTRVRWTTDLLPESVTDQISTMQDQGLAAMKKAFEEAKK